MDAFGNEQPGAEMPTISMDVWLTVEIIYDCSTNRNAAKALIDRLSRGWPPPNRAASRSSNRLQALSFDQIQQLE